MVELRNRVIAAALRVAAAERGGLDGRNDEEEIQNNHDVLAEAVMAYAAGMGMTHGD